VKFAPGEVLVRRHWRGGRVTRMHVLRVAADDEQGLRLWLPSGSTFWRAEDGGQLGRSAWQGPDVMLWLPDNKPYSVCWFWADGMFDGWSANLEEPYVRWADRGCAGVDTADHSLGLVVRPDRSWRWRDEDEFHARTGHPLYWTEAQAAQIRGVGDRLVKLVETSEFPFDGTWCGWRPDASWTLPGLPPGHDRPRALAPRP
jgi:Protein of unknown function (DUF402)